MAHEDTPEQQAQQQEQQTTVDAAATGTTTTPTDEEVGLAVLDAARYGDLEDLQELAKAYGGRHLGYQQEGAQGGNTALHYGMRGRAPCRAMVGWLVGWLVGWSIEAVTDVLRDGRTFLLQPAPMATWSARPGCWSRAWRGAPPTTAATPRSVRGRLV